MPTSLAQGLLTWAASNTDTGQNGSGTKESTHHLSAGGGQRGRGKASRVCTAIADVVLLTLAQGITSNVNLYLPKCKSQKVTFP